MTGSTTQVLAVGLICAAISTPARGQTAGATPLTLDEAIARGLQESHRIGELRERSRAAQAAVDARQSASRPQVSVLAGYTRTNHVEEFGVLLPNGALRLIYPDIPDNYRGRVDLQWPIYTGGRVDALVRAAEAEVHATTSDLDAARADLRLEITRAYWALASAMEAVRVLEESVRRAEAHVGDVRVRLENGIVPPNEVLSAEAQRSHQQLLLIEVRNQREQMAAELRRLTGLAPDAAIELRGRIDEPAAAPPPLDELIARARASRPERQSIVRRVEAAGDRVTAAMAGARPVVSLGGGVDYARPNPRIFPRQADWRESWDGSINVSWSLWDGGRVRADVAEASASKAAVEERLAEFDRVVDLDVRQRWFDLSSAEAALPAADAAVRSATEARRVVAERFSAGVATNTEVIDAQVAMLQAELERTRAFANLRLAEARLARATGQ
jgi:outer membrane protein